MAIAESHEESQAVILIAGLLTIGALLFISLVALGGPVWMGVLFGMIELSVAWRVSAPAGARPLRWITAVLGAVTVAFAIILALN